MTANTNIDISNLDFDSIKSAFKNYLKAQPTFTDYNFEGSGLSTLLNILAYNTHYNAYYLNTIANEMFLDSSVKRSSVISHAKLLNYTPKSIVASKALINIKVSGISDTSSLTIPKNTLFYSESIDSVNYSFITTEDYTASVVNNIANFYNISIIQGTKTTYSYNVNENVSQTYKIPDKNIDTSTIKVYVKENSGSTNVEPYNKATDILMLNDTSLVYFLQEALDEYYEIYFGDGILGKSLTSGNIILVEYISTKGIDAVGASKFTLMNSLGNYNVVVTTVDNATGASAKESIESIKYNAPKTYSSHGRAVTKDDYINILENSTAIINIESVNVWGGEDNIPPSLGKLFIAIKPSGGYSITASQKDRLIHDVIKPISVVSVQPEIVDVDYTYIKLNLDLVIDKSKTLLPFSTIAINTKNTLLNIASIELNKFNSVFILPDFIYEAKQSNKSIVSIDYKLYISKKVTPILNSANILELNFNTPLKKNFEKGVLTSTAFSYVEPSSGYIYNGVKLEAIPLIFNTIESIQVSNSGSGYSSIPTITIYGDGKGAEATVEIVNNRVKSITVINSGSGYTQAIAIITGGGGKGATALINLSGNIIKLRSYYYTNNIKTILQDEVGYINTLNGFISITNFTPYDIDNPLGIFEIIVEPDTTIIKSERDKIITIDNLDTSSISINTRTL